MQPPGTSTTAIASVGTARRLSGWRAVIEFTPKPTSHERLCAGVVIKKDTGEVSYQVAIDGRKMEHAFGKAGFALHDVAEQLCLSLTEHWAANADATQWAPPFVNARLERLERFSAKDSNEALERMLNRTSSLHTLLSAYEIQQQQRPAGIVERVRTAVKRDVNARHLTNRFNRVLDIGQEAQPLRVDFLGQRFACYFLQITHSARGIETSSDRAFGRLYELQALKRMVKKPRKRLGLLEDERPEVFELMMVGDRGDSIQRRVINQVEALADSNQVIARIVPSVNEAAERVADQERKAA